MASQPAPRIRLSRASTSVSEEEQQIYHERSEVSATEEDLWQALTPEHLVMLRRYFIQPRGWSGRGSLSIAGEDETEYRNLTRPQFIDAVTTLLDTEKFEGVCGAIFDAIIAAMTPSLPSTTTTTTTTSSSGLTGGPISSSSSNISTSSSSVGGSTLTLGISWRGLVTYLAEGVSGLCEASPPDPLFSPSVKYTLLTQNKPCRLEGMLSRKQKSIDSKGRATSLLSDSP
ncbi:hypothetical protein SK128_012745 [Halocaridina rubra]|uniref:Uncharacterized protein n=1 Tax=Halocaridina rubra TaxID=373956 RepID=A0AAN8WZL4_HALRR